MLLLATLACTKPAVEDSADSAVEYRPDTNIQECDTTEIRGSTLDAKEVTEPAHINDVWKLLLYCDDALQTGALRVTVDPPEFAGIDEDVATFLVVGEGTFHMQSGRIKAERLVVVE